jgi:hypothetical protein
MTGCIDAGDDLMKRCFLCDTPPDLLYAQNPEMVALCGLGPLVPGYSVVATRAHARSAADALGTVSTLVHFTVAIRERLAGTYGPTLITEHGRVPACVGGADHHAHCYHAHFLLFPSAPPQIATQARAFFKDHWCASTMEQALERARHESEYFFISPAPDEFLIVTRPGRLIRQFSRMLVADALGRPEDANWQANPRRELALQYARELRGLYGTTT